MSIGTSLFNTNTTHESPDGEEAIFSPSEYFVKTYIRQIAEIVIDFCLSFIISLVGIVTNVIVIVVFSRQGFRDTVNISMTFIAFWDLVKCLGGAMQRMAGPIHLIDPIAGESWTNIGIVAFNYLVCFSSYVSSVLAAYVALERCLCVSIPFQVKSLLTPKFTFIICSLISVVVMCSFVVMWGIYDIVWLYNGTYNDTVAVYRYNSFYEQNKVPLFEYYNLSGILWPMFSFVAIVVCTSIIVFHLRRSSKFRSSNTSSTVGDGSNSTSTTKNTQGSSLSPRDKQVVKMLLVIIAVYVINLSPRISLYLVKYFVYDLYFLRKYHNLFLIISYFLFVFDLSNGAINLAIFVCMSSTFRATLRDTFHFCTVGKQKQNLESLQLTNLKTVR